ncbi:MAG: XylR family transcriptional regulator [Planctomycetaceae bacterium]|nr:XylR family transcriptional regulator [Planctomycetaceae bacterium]
MSRRSVALLLETSNAYSRGLLDGVISFVRRQNNWSVFLPEQERGASPPDWLRRWRGDGIIARIETEEIADVVRRIRLPVVDVSAGRFLTDIPWVETDDAAISRLAASHLLERGLKNLAYCGDPGFNWSRWRETQFRECVENAGAQYFAHQSIPRHSREYSWNQDRRRLTRWVRSLPRPVGIMACYDIKAQQLLAICRDEGVRVPDEIAVIGVDNDRRLCELCDPPLSSVVPNTWRTGLLAAEMLDQMMDGVHVGSEGVLVPPMGIETRRSTDVLAADDPEIVAAIQFTRDNALSGATVKDLLQVVPLSRRVLEDRFTKLVGRTPHAELTRLRIERACILLATTDLSMSAVAESTGFRHAEYFSVAFKRATGLPPAEYRRQNRAGG